MGILDLIKQCVKRAVKDVYDIEVDEVFVEHPDNKKWGGLCH